MESRSLCQNSARDWRESGKLQHKSSTGSSISTDTCLDLTTIRYSYCSISNRSLAFSTDRHPSQINRIIYNSDVEKCEPSNMPRTIASCSCSVNSQKRRLRRAHPATRCDSSVPGPSLHHAKSSSMKTDSDRNSEINACWYKTPAILRCRCRIEWSCRVQCLEASWSVAQKMVDIFDYEMT